MTMNENQIKSLPAFKQAPELLDSVLLFQGKFRDRYRLEGWLGRGGYGFTFRGTDILRNVPVTIKFYVEHGDAAFRDWHITSTLKHELIADTFTIEAIEQISGKGKIFISVKRYIPGQSLSSLLTNIKVRNNEIPVFEMIDELLDVFTNDICTAMEFLHKKGFGHGDLHSGNIVITPTESPIFPGQTVPGGVLIDFDDSRTVSEKRSDGGGNREQMRMKDDVVATKGILREIICGTPWADDILRVTETCEEITELKNVFGRMRHIVGQFGQISAHHMSLAHCQNLIGEETALMLVYGNRSSFAAFRAFKTQALSKMGVQERYKEAIRMYAASNRPTVRGEAHQRNISVDSAFRSLLNE